MGKRPSSVALLLLLVICLSYWPVFQAEFVWDDLAFIYDWPLLRQFPENIIAFFKGELVLGVATNYRPLKNVLYALSFQTFGIDPLGYHLVALFGHLCASFLVWLIAKQLTKHDTIPIVTSLLFAVHPIHVESISWITASFDTYGSVLYLLSLWAYFKGRELKVKKLPYTLRWYGLSYVSATLAFFTNELSFSLPAVIMAYEWFIHRAANGRIKRADQIKDIFLNTLPYLVGLGFYFFIRFQVLEAYDQLQPFLNSWSQTGLLAITNFSRYLRYLVVPWPLTPNHLLFGNISALFYLEQPAQPTPFSLTSSQVILSLGLIGSMGWIYLRYLKGPLSRFLSIWLVLALVPVMQIVPTTLLFAERYAYLASVPFCLLVAFALVRLNQIFKLSYLGRWAHCLVLLALVGLTYRYNMVWRSEASLWADSHRINPSAYALNNMAQAALRNNDTNQAINYLETAVQLNPTYAIAYHNLGVYYRQTNQIEKSIEVLEQAYQYQPQATLLLKNLSLSYIEAKRYQEALEYLKKVVAAEPDDVQYQLYLAQTYIQLQDLDSARDRLIQTIKIHPTSGIAYFLLGSIDLTERDSTQAELHFNRALQLEPENQLLVAQIHALLEESK